MDSLRNLESGLENVEWKKLCRLSRIEVISELLIYTPWLILSLFLAHLEMYYLALGASFMFFLCGLRQVHNAFHYAVGVSRNTCEWLMFILSPLMMTSMHAIQFNHLRHHKYCMEEDDVESWSARMPGWKAILIGPMFIFLLHLNAIQKGKNRTKKWIIFELMAMGLFVILAFGILDYWLLKYHVLAMIVGEFFSAFFAVWTVHHNCSQEEIARTIRSKFKAFVTYNMFYHVEHHLFPAVPTRNLPKLAEQIDALGLSYKKNLVF